jgi:hypothetical protein
LSPGEPCHLESLAAWTCEIAGGLEAREAFLFLLLPLSSEGGGAPGGVPWNLSPDGDHARYRRACRLPALHRDLFQLRGPAFRRGVCLVRQPSSWQGIVVSPGEFPLPPRARLCEGLAGGTAPGSAKQTPLDGALSRTRRDQYGAARRHGDKYFFANDLSGEAPSAVGFVHALLDSGLLDRGADGRIEFRFDGVRVDFVMHAA